MTLIVKMMTAGDVPDSDTRAEYRLFAGVSMVDFIRDDQGAATAILLFEGEHETEAFPVVGNVYVMNQQGKTVSSFGASAYPRPPADIGSLDERPVRAAA